MACLAFLRCGQHAETEIDLSTGMGQIQIHPDDPLDTTARLGERAGSAPGPNPSSIPTA